VAAGRDRCDLCGARLSDAALPQREPTAPDSVSEPAREDNHENNHEDNGEGSAPSPERASNENAPARDPTGDAAPGVFCNQCGWKNPVDARFCSQCGTKLQDLSDAPSGASAPPANATSAPEGTRPVSADLPQGTAASPAEDTGGTEEDRKAVTAAADAEQQSMGQQLTLTVGLAMLVVVALFFVTLWSQSQNWGSDDPQPSPQTPTQSGARSPGGSGGAQAAPLSAQGGTFQDLSALAEQTSGSLPDGLARRVDSVRTAMNNASGAEKQRLRQELANLYVGAGQPGKAALQQLEVARASDATEAWRRAGDRLYAWMQAMQQQDQRQQAVPVAEETAEAYATVVSRTPNDLTAQTRMGEAYLLTNNPMRGIQAINDVLATDSTFVPARFQKGLALLQISRFEQAIAEFERVKAFAGEGTPYYQQADRAISIIRERTTSRSPGGSPSGSPSGSRGS
jgi:hypothetical protein